MTIALSSTSKYASESALPGGVERYFDTLVLILKQIRDNDSTSEGLVDWMMRQFPQVTSRSAINSQLSTLARLELWTQVHDICKLTPTGTALLSTYETNIANAQQMIIDLKYSICLGYAELLECLSSGPKSSEELSNHLTQTLDVNWTSPNQSSFRMYWLRSLGCVEREGTEYRLTEAGFNAYRRLQVANEISANCNSVPAKTEIELLHPPYGQSVQELADRLQSMATIGGDGRDFEVVTEAAFQFLGFDTQLISGSGNPDVLIFANMGEKSYRVVIDSKSRTSGIVQQNDVHINVLLQQKQRASADFVMVLGAAFAGGNLEEFAKSHQVRLLSVPELHELLIAHARSAFTLDGLRQLFDGGGKTDESVLSDLLSQSESQGELMQIAYKVFAAVLKYQDRPGALHTDSLFFILGCEHPLSTIRMTVDFLTSELICGLGVTRGESLYTRVSTQTLLRKLAQISRAMSG
ncbi:MAG: restriction endonuclease [Pirellulales bacterium]|nr:restriction endonuclease [Pirellulales bacterium]